MTSGTASQCLSAPRFEKKEKLGEGTYGVVYRAIDLKDDQIVALKEFKLNQEEDGIPATTLREISILKSVSHINIVSLKDVILDGGTIALAFEYLDYDLRFLTSHMKKPMSPELVRSYSFQILCGLFVLHSHRIIHRDLKPANILLSKSGILKICDFGLARFFSIPMRQYSPSVVSLWYRSPELLFGTDRMYGLPIDIWSTGCIIAEMAAGSPLFVGDSEIDQIHSIFSKLGSPNEANSGNFAKLREYTAEFQIYPPKDLSDILHTSDTYLIDLISKMLKYDPTERITVADALRHPYFDQIPKSIRSACWPPFLSEKS